MSQFILNEAQQGVFQGLSGYTRGRDGGIDGEWHRFHIHHMHFIELFDSDFFLLHQRVCIHIQRNVYTGMTQYFTEGFDVDAKL